MLIKRLAQAAPACPAISVGLVEHRNASSINGDKVIDQSLHLLVVRSAQVEGKLIIGRNPVGISPGEREEQQKMLVVMHLQQRQRPVHGRCPDIAEQREDIVFIHQLQRIADCEIGLVLVVIGLDDDTPAVDAAGVVEWTQVGHGATIEFDAERARTCRKIRRHAEADFALAGDLPIDTGAGRFVLRQGRIVEEHGREQEG